MTHPLSFVPRAAALAFAWLACQQAWALGATPVTVTNPADIAKAAGVQRPFQTTVQCPTNPYGNGCYATFGLGAQRLVIEYVSVRCEQIVGQVTTALEVSTIAGGNFGTHELSVSDRVGAQGYYGSGTREVDVGQAVRLYADAGTYIGVGATFNPNSGNSSYPFCVFTLTGQQIDVP